MIYPTAFAFTFQTISIDLSVLAYLSRCVISTLGMPGLWLGLVAIFCKCRYKKVISLLILHISQARVFFFGCGPFLLVPRVIGF